MHLMDVLSWRTVPAAGLFLTLTRRCPLACAHCSTNSTWTSEESSAGDLQRFVNTFTSETRPEILYLTGGEALLRPRLVRTLTEHAHAVGARVVLISGMFFARQRKIPPSIREAIAGVDHFTASLDIFHEQQVSRDAMFHVLREVRQQGQDVSIQIVGLDERDTYLQDATRSIREYFEDRVPALVTYVKAVGRAKTWLRDSEDPTDDLPEQDFEPSPCAVAAWPVVSFNGTIVGCCNQTVVDGLTAPHLCLGHVATDNWPTIRERYLASHILRAIRLFGPEYTNQRYGSGTLPCSGYCSTCQNLSDDPTIAERLQPVMERSSTRFMEHQVARFQRERFADQFGVPAYAHLVRLGYKQDRGAVCVG